MKFQSVLLSAAAVALCLVDAGSSRASVSPVNPSAAIAPQVTLAADPLELPATLQAQIDAAVAACDCFSSVTSWQVSPTGTAAQVFSSPDVLFAMLDLDVQLPWVAAGEINAGALSVRLGSQAGLINQISSYADPSGGGFRLGAYQWSHPTAPDFCSGETLYFMYFERTGVLFAFRFDSSHEC